MWGQKQMYNFLCIVLQILTAIITIYIEFFLTTYIIVFV